MVIPTKPSEVQNQDKLSRITKKSVRNEIDEKYRTKAKPKKVAGTQRKEKGAELKKTLSAFEPNKKMAGKSIVSIRSVRSKSNLATMNASAKEPTKRIDQLSKPVKLKSKVTKSESAHKLKPEKPSLNKRHKFNKTKVNKVTPPLDSFFKPEGPANRPQIQTNKAIGKLITPKLNEERCDIFEKEIKSKFTGVTRVEHSNISLLMSAQEDSDIKLHDKPKKYKKTRPVARKGRKKLSVEKVSEIDLYESSSDEKQVLVKEIKHNDSFVLSAKKLMNTPNKSKSETPRQEFIKIVRKSGIKAKVDSGNKIKPCLKKNEDKISDAEEEKRPSTQKRSRRNTHNKAIKEYSALKQKIM